ncbi:MAG: ThiF family adenylyltransferase [Paraclostridium sp.]
MKYLISTLFDIVINNNNIYIVGDEIFCLENCSKNVITAINKLKSGCSLDELEKVLGKSDTNELLVNLDSINALKEDYDNNYTNTIVEKQIYYLESISKNPNELQKNLESKTICILGVGGVGSIVFQHLLGAGLKSFILIDGDKVELNNFNRQFIYNKNNINEFKVNAAKDYALNLDNDINIETYNKFINGSSDLSFLDKYNIDFFVCAADFPKKSIYNIVNDYCVNKNIPFSFSSVGLNSGSWGPIIVPHKTKCYKCFCEVENQEVSDLEKVILDNIDGTLMASFGPTNTIVSTFMSKDIFSFLCNPDSLSSSSIRWSLDFNTMKFTSTSIPSEACNCQCI